MGCSLITLPPTFLLSFIAWALDFQYDTEVPVFEDWADYRQWSLCPAGHFIIGVDGQREIYGLALD